MRLVFETLGETQINREFLRLQEHTVDASPAFEMIYDYLLRVEQMQFDTEGAQSGHKWADLAASTIRAKARANLRPEILRATDALINSLTQEQDPNQVKIIKPDQLVFGTTLPYGAMHQSPGDGANYPQRRPIDLTEANKVAIMKSLQLYIMRGVAAPITALQGDVQL